MRKIKLRVWNGEKMDDTYVLEAGDEFYINMGSKIMLYTGLKDKNGKEIYEGDIIEEVEDEHRNLGVVEFCSMSAAFVLRMSTGKHKGNPIYMHNWESQEHYYLVKNNVYEKNK